MADSGHQQHGVLSLQPRFRQLRCVFCSQVFFQHNALLRHINQFHRCIHCMECSSDLSAHNCQPLHGLGQGRIDFNPHPFSRTRHALHGSLQVYERGFHNQYVNVESIFRDNMDDIILLLTNSILAHRNVKFQVGLKIQMLEVFSRGVEMKYFNSNMFPLLNANSAKPFLVQCANQIIQQLNAFVELASTWTVLDIVQLTVNVAEFNQLAGGYNLNLPDSLKRRRGIANCPFEESCFQFATMAGYLGLKTKKDIGRQSSYTRLLVQNESNEIIDFSDLGSEVSLNDIAKFERKNPAFSFSVFGFMDKEVFPMRVTNLKKEYHINLLLFHSSELKKSHYLFIFDLSSFLSKFKGKSFFCVYCLSRYKTERECAEHENNCKQFEARALKFYPEGKKLQIDLTHYSQPSSLAVYFDFESIINKRRGNGKNVQALLEPFAVGYVVVTQDSQVLEYGTYMGNRADNVCVKTMISLAEKYLPRTQAFEKNMIITPDGIERLNSHACCICEKELGGNDTVRHHNHSAYPVNGIQGGHIIGPAHSKCNLNSKSFTELPFLSHNFAKFDSLQLIKGLSQNCVQNLTCIARSSSNFISISFNKCRLLDSYLHLPFSLKECVRILKESGLEHFKVTKYVFSKYKDFFNDIIDKQVYCYEYATMENIFERKDSLPPIEAFYNSLTDSHITQDEYDHAQKMYKIFACRTLSDYCKIYLILDITLLADVFSYHRNLCLSTFRIDPLYFYSTPSMAFKLALGTSGIALSYITSSTIFNAARSSMRGGIVNFTRRYCEANCKELPNYDNKKKAESIIMLDVSQLYSYSMLHKLAYDECRVLDEEEKERFNIYEPKIDDDYGYLMTVDITIDPESHSLLDSFPIAPEQIIIDAQEASILQHSLTDDLGNSFMKQFKNVQLSLNLYDKKKYTLHLYMLQLYLQLPGVRLTKIHQIIKYRQVAFMKSFIESASKKRRETNDVALKSYYKLLCNSSFGYSAVKICDYIDIKFVKTREEGIALVSKPNFKGFTIVTSGLAILESSPISVLVRNFLLVSSCILERSKHLIFKHWYFGYLKYFNSIYIDISILYQDTDSILMACGVHYEELIEHLSKITVDGDKIVALSFLNKNHPYYNDQLKNKVGSWHSETDDHKILAACILRKKIMH